MDNASLAPNRNTGGVTTKNIPVPVRGMPSGGATGTKQKTAGDTYGADIKAACKMGAQEGKTPQESSDGTPLKQ